MPVHERLSGELSLPVAVRSPPRRHGIALDRALEGYLHAFTANLISAAVRPCRWARATARSPWRRWSPRLRQATERRSPWPSLDEIGTARRLARLVLARHETQYTGCSAHDLLRSRCRSSSAICRPAMPVGPGRHLAGGQRGAGAAVIGDGRAACRRRGSASPCRAAAVVAAWPWSIWLAAQPLGLIGRS
jgi:hypothetical protein